MACLIISEAVLTKLREKHQVGRREVEQAFENKCGCYLTDEREDHQTDPPTLWFVAPTHRGRPLKVIFIFIDGNVHLKSAYTADAAAISIYDAVGK